MLPFKASPMNICTFAIVGAVASNSITVRLRVIRQPINVNTSRVIRAQFRPT